MPIEIRISKRKHKVPTGTDTHYIVTAVFALMHTAVYPVADWKAFLKSRGWYTIPRVWD